MVKYFGLEQNHFNIQCLLIFFFNFKVGNHFEISSQICSLLKKREKNKTFNIYFL